jgi:hypothetical protein
MVGHGRLSLGEGSRMNERIKELYMQAIQYADSVVPPERRYNDIYYAIASAKHAELIVKECAAVSDKWDDQLPIGDMIKEHFGVEE